jgi:hypothetical protein
MAAPPRNTAAPHTRHAGLKEYGSGPTILCIRGASGIVSGGAVSPSASRTAFTQGYTPEAGHIHPDHLISQRYSYAIYRITRIGSPPAEYLLFFTFEKNKVGIDLTNKKEWNHE